MSRREACPFCEGTLLDTMHLGELFWVLCKRCRAMGPSAKTRAEAERLWNSRAPHNGQPHAHITNGKE